MTRPPAPASAPPVPKAAVAFTILALVAVNVALAYLLAQTVGARPVELPVAAPLALATLGLACGVTAVLRWRAFVRRARGGRLGE